MPKQLRINNNYTSPLFLVLLPRAGAWGWRGTSRGLWQQRKAGNSQTTRCHRCLCCLTEKMYCGNYKMCCCVTSLRTIPSGKTHPLTMTWHTGLTNISKTGGEQSSASVSDRQPPFNHHVDNHHVDNTLTTTTLTTTTFCFLFGGGVNSMSLMGYPPQNRGPSQCPRWHATFAVYADA